jgi:hypothetical protein
VCLPYRTLSLTLCAPPWPRSKSSAKGGGSSKTKSLLVISKESKAASWMGLTVVTALMFFAMVLFRRFNPGPLTAMRP